jgi:hypothetical protein
MHKVSNSQLARVFTSLFAGLLITTTLNSPAHAATVNATGAHPTPAACNQTVSDGADVEAVRLADGDCLVTFKSGSTDWTSPPGLTTAQVLLVGAGGGGGGTFDTRGAGGGGGGGVKTESNYVLTGSSVFTISVGAKGTGGLQPARTNAPQNVGSNGGNSKITFGGSDILIAYGGLGGCASRTTAYESYCTISANNATGGETATATSGGGRGGATGGGGGGSAGAGGAAIGGSGGAGTSVSITGTSVIYGVGGNGGRNNTNAVGTSASANTGNGGRGASSGGGTNYNGGDGGSGLIVLRYSLITDVSISFSSGSQGIYRSLGTITATTTLAGKVTFYERGRVIPGCKNRPTNGSLVATCTWRPSVRGNVAISATNRPTNSYISNASSSLSVFVTNRTGART